VRTAAAFRRTMNSAMFCSLGCAHAEARVCTVRFLAANVDPWICRSMAVSNFMI
jgi:hypothetical protein